MIIRKATKTDYEAIANFAKSVAMHHVKNRPDILKNAPDLSEKEFKETVKDKNWLILVAEKDGKPVGCCKTLIREIGDEYWTSMKLLYIYEMYVDPSCRRMGIGAALLDETKRIGKEIGATQIELDVWSFNESAISLYEKAGFVPQRVKMELKIQPEHNLE